MSPCRYSVLSIPKPEIGLGLLRQRKLSSSRESGRSLNPGVFTGTGFILTKAFALMLFHTNGWPGGTHK